MVIQFLVAKKERLGLKTEVLVDANTESGSQLYKAFFGPKILPQQSIKSENRCKMWPRAGCPGVFAGSDNGLQFRTFSALVVIAAPKNQTSHGHGDGQNGHVENMRPAHCVKVKPAVLVERVGKRQQQILLFVLQNAIRKQLHNEVRRLHI